MPLEFDQSRSNEPFLRLPPPYQNIILTPPRKSDGPRVVECLNDPKVYTSLLGPPFPYTHQNFEFWYNSIEKQCAEGLKQYLEVKGGMDGSGEQGKRKWANACPVRIIREVNPETGAQEFIGDLGIDRHGYSGETKDQQDKLRELNYSYEDGDERIDWDIGDFLAASHHGRGIMTAALRTLIQDYAVPCLNAHRIRTTVFEGNIASRRVFEKNGFTSQGLGSAPIKLPESRGGQEIRLELLSWDSWLQ